MHRFDVLMEISFIYCDFRVTISTIKVIDNAFMRPVGAEVYGLRSSTTTITTITAPMLRMMTTQSTINSAAERRRLLRLIHTSTVVLQHHLYAADATLTPFRGSVSALKSAFYTFTMMNTCSSVH